MYFKVSQLSLASRIPQLDAVVLRPARERAAWEHGDVVIVTHTILHAADSNLDIRLASGHVASASLISVTLRTTFHSMTTCLTHLLLCKLDWVLSNLKINSFFHLRPSVFFCKRKAFEHLSSNQVIPLVDGFHFLRHVWHSILQTRAR